MTNEIDVANGRRKWSVDPSKRWLPAFTDYGNRTPIRNALITVQGIFAFGALMTTVLLVAPSSGKRMPLFAYIFSDQWARGVNLFAVTSIVILLLEVVAVLILLKLIVQVISMICGTRGETICRLIRSLILYVALFAFVIIALTDIGISMAAILTAVGTLGIAVSLGAQHFVSDIIAGLTMVFEGTVHVGDIVKLGNGSKVYHGEVREIGLRFIRIQTSDGNIVTLSNRDIDMTTNMTTMNSRCTCSFTISSVSIAPKPSCFTLAVNNSTIQSLHSLLRSTLL